MLQEDALGQLLGRLGALVRRHPHAVAHAPVAVPERREGRPDGVLHLQYLLEIADRLERSEPREHPDAHPVRAGSPIP